MKKDYNGGVIPKVVGCLIIAFYFIGTVVMIPVTVANKESTIWKEYDFSAFCHKVRMDLPEDVICFGTGVSEICARIEKEMNVYPTDWSNVADREWLYEKALEYEYIFTSQDLSEREEFSSYDVVNDWDYKGNYEFYLYKKTE